MQQGRRTASLKASYEAINTGNHGHEFSIGRELAGAAQTAIQAIQQDHANNKKKQKYYIFLYIRLSQKFTPLLRTLIFC